MLATNIILSLITINRSDWVTPETWKCLDTVVQTYFTMRQILYITDTESDEHLRNQQFYRGSNEITSEYENYDVIIIAKSWTSIDFQPSLPNRVLILSESTEDTTELWEKFKLLYTVVMVQEEDAVLFYSWFPYQPKYCTDDTELVHINTWKNGKFLKDKQLFQSMKKFNLMGCPVLVSCFACPPYITGDDKTLQFSGPNYGVLRELISSINGSMKHTEIEEIEFYYGGGPLFWLEDREIDMFYSCLPLYTHGAQYHAQLPSSQYDNLIWAFPGPIAKPYVESYINSYSPEVWIAIAITFLSMICSYNLLTKVSIARGFLWTTSRCLAASLPEPSAGMRLNFLGLVFELCMIVLGTIYQANILINLSLSPTKIINNPYDGLDSGLVTLVRQTDIHLLNVTDVELWNKILVPENHIKNFSLDYKRLLDRRAMALIWQYIDRAEMHHLYPNESYTHYVTDGQVYTKINFAGIMPLKHPLYTYLSTQMLIIISTGIPEYHLQQMIAKIERDDAVYVASTLKPLILDQLLPIFYLLGIGIIIATAAFLVEVLGVLLKTKSSTAKKVGQNQLPATLGRKKIVAARQTALSFLQHRSKIQRW